MQIQCKHGMVITCGENYTYDMILKISLMFLPLKHFFRTTFICVFILLYIFPFLYTYLHECFQGTHYQREANTYIRYEYIFIYVIYIYIYHFLSNING